MKKFLKGLVAGIAITISVSAVAIIGGGVLTHNHSGTGQGGSALINSTLTNATIVGGLTGFSIADANWNTIACATNYVRIGPNFCLAEGAGVLGLTTINTTCTSQAAPANAVAMLIGVQAQIDGNNLAGLATAQLQVFKDATCATTNVTNINFSAQEFVAVTAGTEISKQQGTVIAPVASSNAHYKATVGPNANTNLQVWIVGYFD